MPVVQKVLVIEDDEVVRGLVHDALQRGGFETVPAVDGETGLDLLAKHDPALVILDIRLPGVDGLEVLRRLRNGSAGVSVPVILLTAEGAETDRIVGLELGADDYVTKPFSPRELVARVRSVLRRGRGGDAPKVAQLERGQLLVNFDRHEVSYAGRLIPLTATEFRIVEALATQAGKLLTRAAIHEAVHHTPAATEDRAIDAHIKSIRRKLGEGADEVETLRGFGYRWR
jgi:two-component system phosphate regulon response regulator PhoB